jgi:hypothetical protein
MAKHTLVKNGTLLKKVQAQVKREWQTLPFKGLHQHRGSSPTSPTTSTLLLVSCQKGDKVHLFNASIIDGSDDEHSMKKKMINKFGLNGYNIITKLMEKLGKRKANSCGSRRLIHP